jgi:RNA polymerase sigma factor (sigma-70 family)
MEISDEQVLLGRARLGDEIAYERLLVSLVEPAHKLACGLLHDSHLAEDVVQEAAVKAWRRLGNLRPGAPIRPWFLGIVANQCRDFRRGHWGRLITKRDVDLRLDPPDEEALRPDEEALRRIEVRRALERLNKHDRLIVVLHIYLEMPWPEIAVIAGLTEAGARTRFYRAVAKIRPRDHAPVTV